MASSYSPLLRLELIASGEQAGLWGNTTNVNFSNLIEQAIAGVTTVTLTGTGDRTITTTNGTPDEARSAVLVFGGTPGGAVNILIPALQKWYIVRNGTPSTLTFKTAAQTGGVQVTAGNATMIFCDGTNVYLGVSPGSIGAADNTGTNASGTWGINISGNAATATLAATATVANSVANGVTTSMLSQSGGASKVPQYMASGDLALGTAMEGTWDGTSAASIEPSWATEFGDMGALACTPAPTHEMMGGGATMLVHNGVYHKSLGWRTKTGQAYPVRLVMYGGGLRVENASTGGWVSSSDNASFGWTTRLAVSTGGCTSVAFSQSSDRRRKKDLERVSYAMAKVRQINGYTYLRTDWDETLPREMGLVAQEVQEVAPEVVRTDEEGYLTVMYGNLVALLVEALKEQDLRLRELEAKVNA